jgi:hypothetical protein
VSEATPETPTPAAEAPQGAFAKDKKFGNRLDLTMAIGEPFLLLGAVPDEPVETKFGMSDSAKLLIQKINPDTGAPQGAPLRVVTVASAIVEKVLALTREELAAGPVVQLQHVHSKTRDTGALVLSWMRNLTDVDDFSEFGLDAAAVSRAVDLARPEKDRIPY